MEVRPATAGDAPAVTDVARDSWEADYPDVLNRENVAEAAEEWYAPDRIREVVADEDAVLLVAEADGAVVGFAHAVLWSEPPTGSILRLYAHPDHRRRGVASELLEATVGTLRERGADRVEAMALAANDRADEFYRSAGFEPHGSAETEIAGESYEETVYVRRG